MVSKRRGRGRGRSRGHARVALWLGPKPWSHGRRTLTSRTRGKWRRFCHLLAGWWPWESHVPSLSLGPLVWVPRCPPRRPGEEGGQCRGHGGHQVRHPPPMGRVLLATPDDGVVPRGLGGDGHDTGPAPVGLLLTPGTVLWGQAAPPGPPRAPGSQAQPPHWLGRGPASAGVWDRPAGLRGDLA